MEKLYLAVASQREVLASSGEMEIGIKMDTYMGTYPRCGVNPVQTY
jgi:hypothetical protein